MDIADELDKAMRDFRNGKGITQPELTALSGVPQPTISRTLKGKSTPETKTLIKLAAALNCTLGGYTGKSSSKLYGTANVRELGAKERDGLPPALAEILRIAHQMSPQGQHVLLGRAQEIAATYPAAKANHSS